MHSHQCELTILKFKGGGSGDVWNGTGANAMLPMAAIFSQGDCLIMT